MKPKILFVDDEQNILDSLRLSLRNMRDAWDMTFVLGGRAALDALAQSPHDVVVSDMAAPTTGHPATDHLRIIGLVEVALHFAMEVLAPGGVFVAKVFQGGTEKTLLDLLKKNFETVRHAKPPASRKESAETYVVATGFKGERPDAHWRDEREEPEAE